MTVFRNLSGTAGMFCSSQEFFLEAIFVFLRIKLDFGASLEEKNIDKHISILV